MLRYVSKTYFQKNDTESKGMETRTVLRGDNQVQQFAPMTIPALKAASIARLFTWRSASIMAAARAAASSSAILSAFLLRPRRFFIGSPILWRVTKQHHEQAFNWQVFFFLFFLVLSLRSGISDFHHLMDVYKIFLFFQYQRQGFKFW